MDKELEDIIFNDVVNKYINREYNTASLTFVHIFNIDGIKYQNIRLLYEIKIVFEKNKTFGQTQYELSWKGKANCKFVQVECYNEFRRSVKIDGLEPLEKRLSDKITSLC